MIRLTVQLDVLWLHVRMDSAKLVEDLQGRSDLSTRYSPQVPARQFRHRDIPPRSFEASGCPRGQPDARNADISLLT